MRTIWLLPLLLSGCLQGGPSTPAPGLSDDERCAREREANARLKADTIAAATEAAAVEAARVAGKIVAQSQPKPVERKPETRRPVQQGYTGAKVFTVPWCGPCKVLVSMLKDLASRTGWTVGPGPEYHWWIVTDRYSGESPEVSESYPTVVYYVNGVAQSVFHVGFDTTRPREVFDGLLRRHPAYPGEGR